MPSLLLKSKQIIDVDYLWAALLALSLIFDLLKLLILLLCFISFTNELKQHWYLCPVIEIIDELFIG